MPDRHVEEWYQVQVSASISTFDLRRALLVAVDAEKYGAQHDGQQAFVQKALVGMLDEAANKSGLCRSGWTRQSTGDGELAVLPDSEPQFQVVDDFARHLAGALQRHNLRLAEEFRVRLRLAIHYGTASPADNGFAGQGVVLVSRLVDGKPVRMGLSQTKGDLAVVYSDTIYKDIISQGHTTIDLQDLRRVQVKHKETDERAWLWLPDGARSRRLHRRRTRVATLLLLAFVGLALTVAIGANWAASSKQESGRILDPGPTSQVRNPVNVSGLASLPEDRRIWLLLRAPNNAYYTVTARPAPLDVGTDGRWSLRRVGVGKGADDVGKEFELVLVAVDRGGRFERQVEAGRPGRTSVEFERLPDEADVLDRVAIQLAG